MLLAGCHGGTADAPLALVLTTGTSARPIQGGMTDGGCKYRCSTVVSAGSATAHAWYGASGALSEARTPAPSTTVESVSLFCADEERRRALALARHNSPRPADEEERRVLAG